MTYGYFISSPSWNPNSRFDLTLAVVENRELSIDRYHVNTGDKALFQGHYYSDKAPGVSFLALPAYSVFRAIWKLCGGDSPTAVAIGRDGRLDSRLSEGDGNDDVLLNRAFRWGQYVASVFTSGLAGASLAVMIFLAAKRQGRSEQDATAIAMALSIGTLVFPYSTTLYGHVPAAALTFAGLFTLWLYERPGSAAFFASGFCCSLATVCEWPAGMIAALIGLGTLLRFRRSWKICLWASGAAVPAIVVLAYNQAAFGSPLALGYSNLATPAFAIGMSHGLMGIGLPSISTLFEMLLGRARGILYTSPILLLATWGLVRRSKGLSTIARPAAVVTPLFLMMSSGYFLWWGGAAFGPRHVIPTVPFWCLGLILIWPRSPGAIPQRDVTTKSWFGHLVFACLAVSVMNMLLGTAVGPEAPLGSDILFRYAYPLAAKGRIPFAPGASNLGRLIGLPGALSLAPLGIAWGVYISWVWHLFPFQNRSPKALEHE
jgi:hypothetical protein